SPDAALRLPALGGHAHVARGAGAQMGDAEPLARLPHAAGRRAADPAPDGADVSAIAADALRRPTGSSVAMPAPVAGIHVGTIAPGCRAWMAGTSPARTAEALHIAVPRYNLSQPDTRRPAGPRQRRRNDPVVDN